MEVRLVHLSKHFGDVVAVEDLNLHINSGEFVALLGPSGCGKTTTLLMIAGIYIPTRGEIWFGDRLVNDLLPKDRNIGMVFQSYALYPHMTVFENISFPLKLRGVPMEERRRRAQRVADMMQIGHLMERKPGQLSGGQQQRVALARALVKEPDILLFDEPLSNLDAKLRLTMRSELKRLQHELGITSIYVTHDQVEAMTMADRIAVMRDGYLQAFAPPEELYNRPKTLFVAGFIGSPPMNFLKATLLQENGKAVVRGAGFKVTLPDDLGKVALERAAGREVIYGLRPEHMSIDPTGEVLAEVYVIEPLGREDLIDCRLADGTIVGVLAPAGINVHPGEKVRLRFDVAHSQLFDPETEQTLLW